MTDFNSILQQARQMQENLQREQKKLEETEITGTSGGGMVRIDLTAKYVVRRVKIDPSLIVADDAAILEDLLVAAFNDATSKVEAKTTEMMAGVLPAGMKLPF